MKVLVTGCFGFIGRNFIDYLIKNNIDFIGLDSLETEASKKLFNDSKYENKNFYKINICDLDSDDVLKNKNIDAVVNFAAQTHVDNSISNPDIFINSNILGVAQLLKFCLKNKIENIIHVSTDEVYGSNQNDFFSEVDHFNPSSPYSASKASAELICKSFTKTYGQNIKIVRPANNYGIYQQPEKLIPFSIAQLKNDKNIEVYGNGKQVRHWLHVEDTVSAIYKILTEDEANGIYNIGSGEYLENIALVKNILNHLKLGEDRIDYVEDRPGHDFRYAINFDNLINLGWEPKRKLSSELPIIIDWYSQNKDFWLDDYLKIVDKRKTRLNIN